MPKERNPLFGDPKKALLLDTHPEAQQDLVRLPRLPHIPGPLRKRVKFENGAPPVQLPEASAAVQEPGILPDLDEDTADANTDQN